MLLRPLLGTDNYMQGLHVYVYFQYLVFGKVSYFFDYSIQITFYICHCFTSPCNALFYGSCCYICHMIFSFYIAQLQKYGNIKKQASPFRCRIASNLICSLPGVLDTMRQIDLFVKRTCGKDLSRVWMRPAGAMEK